MGYGSRNADFQQDSQSLVVAGEPPALTHLQMHSPWPCCCPYQMVSSRETKCHNVRIRGMELIYLDVEPRQHHPEPLELGHNGQTGSQ